MEIVDSQAVVRLEYAAAWSMIAAAVAMVAKVVEV